MRSLFRLRVKYWFGNVLVCCVLLSWNVFVCVCVMVVNTKIIPMNFQLASIVWVSGSVCASFFQFQLELFFSLYSSLFTIHVCIQMHVERIILFIWENQFVKHLRTPWYNRNRYIAKTTIKIEKKMKKVIWKRMRKNDSDKKNQQPYERCLEQKAMYIQKVYTKIRHKKHIHNL